MTDLFDSRGFQPMLIGQNQDAFDSPDYLYELKLDGERCLAYLDQNGTDLRNKRGLKMLSKVPELSEIHQQVKTRCVLDGELIVMKEGKPDFDEIKRRSLMSNEFRIELSASRYPASFTAFDILYYKDHSITDLSLVERKKLLQDTVTESDRLAVSRYIEDRGLDLYKLTEEKDLEGIVAKKKDSRYVCSERTKDWIKCKNLQDDDFVVCGYVEKENAIASIILGQYSKGKLLYKGRVTLGVSGDDFQTLKKAGKANTPLFPGLNDNEVVWLEPAYACTVRYMMKNPSGSLRQPVSKGLRMDKTPEECIEKV
ncbi:MAG: RNA ligase family protein [Clostridiaceae bacterium]|nr:RNA ligase family protein [Clostridiaceae bacterium]